MPSSFTTPWTVDCPWDFPGKNTGVGCPFLLQANRAGTQVSCLAGGFFYHWATREDLCKLYLKMEKTRHEFNIFQNTLKLFVCYPRFLFLKKYKNEWKSLQFRCSLNFWHILWLRAPSEKGMYFMYPHSPPKLKLHSLLKEFLQKILIKNLLKDSYKLTWGETANS